MNWVHIGIAGIIISIILSLREFLIVIKSYRRINERYPKSIHAWIISGNSPLSVVSSYRASLEMLSCAVMLAGGLSYVYEEIYLSVFLFTSMIGIQGYIIYMAYSYGKATKN
ncbi:hypothetical protein [Methylobacterium sp. Leaf100]|uniref:hypothetical protein n=1 Tax=Methylobacterium sp. Leaf100 TaxID=1736252 RepID=UPI000AC612DD|nr:hypothetical protein [Methylobacterium sp. Leaf100]